ncbi:MAG: ATP synthase F1 subunit gamma [Patescibacteria group bacterium]|nr:ATP synthase F1 subunit gamma [Patescibacteria group bacterium]MDD4610385.1 ATP synthase F1 subunit gamma [Patescibacteria group bacterium]
MANTKEIQRRIKSIGSTKKITKAMEMVAAAKMRRAIEAVLRTRTYANLSWSTILNLSQASGKEELHPLLKKRDEIKKICVILISSNRGMCGSLNTALINKVQKSIEKYQTKDGKVAIETDFVVIGKKGEAVYRYYGYNIAAEFPKKDLIDEVGEIIPVAKMIITDFLNKKYDKVMVAYTDFVSATKQVPRVKQLLPIDIEAQDDYLGIVGKDTRVGLDKEFVKGKEEKHLKTEKFSFEYTFEPSPMEVLDEMIPRLIEIQLYQAMLESNASEHSARMAAMHQATEAATDMVSELTLSFNKARQAIITNEIAEISAGANALKN